ncbi:Cysteine desulfuration protein SufE [bacterium HR40]|nr:Cysteine desulfuration protein SufE [bacterium HR40]
MVSRAMAGTSPIREEEARIREEFALFDDPRGRLEYIIELGKGLPPLEESARTEANRVRGCQSQVWLVADYDPASDRLSFRADSDALIVRGLIALLLRLYSGRHPAEIASHEPEVFEDIGLSRLLTPGRQNGLWSMIRRIREIASVYAGRAAAVSAG